MRLKPISQRFHSVTTFVRPFSIDIVGQGDLLRRFDLSWKFTPAADGCLVSLHVGIGVSFRPLRLAIDVAAREMGRKLVESFVKEAGRRIRQQPAADRLRPDVPCAPRLGRVEIEGTVYHAEG